MRHAKGATPRLHLDSNLPHRQRVHAPHRLPRSPRSPRTGAVSATPIRRVAAPPASPPASALSNALVSAFAHTRRGAQNRRRRLPTSLPSPPIRPQPNSMIAAAAYVPPALHVPPSADRSPETSPGAATIVARYPPPDPTFSASAAAAAAAAARDSSSPTSKTRANAAPLAARVRDDDPGGDARGQSEGVKRPARSSVQPRGRERVVGGGYSQGTPGTRRPGRTHPAAAAAAIVVVPGRGARDYPAQETRALAEHAERGVSVQNPGVRERPERRRGVRSREVVRGVIRAADDRCLRPRRRRRRRSSLDGGGGVDAHMSASNDSADATDAARSGIAASDASAATDSTPGRPCSTSRSMRSEMPDWTNPAPCWTKPGPALDVPVVAWEEKTSASSGCASPGEGSNEPVPATARPISGAAIRPEVATGHQRGGLGHRHRRARRTLRGGPRRSVLDSLDDGIRGVHNRRLDRVGVASAAASAAGWSTIRGRKPARLGRRPTVWR